MSRPVTLMAWLAALLLCMAPVLIGADSGGVLPWTQWAAAVACVVAIGLALPDCLAGPQPGSWHRHTLAILVLAVAGYGFVQALPLPGRIAGSLAPGSAAAYSTWLSPLRIVPQDAELLQTTWPRISIDATRTRTAAWLTVMIAGYAMLASQLFTDRSRLQLLLIALALTGAAQAGLGLYQLLTAPDATAWGIRSQYGGKPFGSFVNRSNATVMLNLGLAGSLGLIAWRLAALTGAPLNAERFPLTELLDIAFDRLAALALMTASLSIIGLMICGSRSGLVGLVGGFMLALGMVQSANRLRGFVATSLGLGLMVAIVMVNLNLSALSVERLGATAGEIIEKADVQDGRFPHWRDGFVAATQQPATGWGWGVYRYAYLPFQKTSAGVWFVNADNLWLEVLVEIGAVGMALVGLSIFVIIRSLSQLALSADPIDHGLVIAGWFALGALAFSQFFDFGLRIPANSIMAAILFSVVISRRYSAGSRVVNSQPRRSFRLDLVSSEAQSSLPATRNRSPRVGGALMIFAGLAVIAAANALAWQARGDKAIRMARRLPQDNRIDVRVAEAVTASLMTYLNANPHDSDALAELSRLETDLARIRAARQISQSSPRQSVTELLGSFSRPQLRTAWYSESAANFVPLFSDQHSSAAKSDSKSRNTRLHFDNALSNAREHAVAALAASPFSPEARFRVLALDFAGGDPQQSVELLQQAATLRKQNTAALLHAGDLAAEAGDWQFAASSWKRAAHLQPGLAVTVLRRITSTPQLRPDDVISNSPQSLRVAASIEIAKSDPDAALLARAVEELRRSLPSEVLQRASQLRLIAKIQNKLNRSDDAVATLQQATLIHPRDVNLRLEYASALLAVGKFDEAKEQARIGRQIAPSDSRFEILIHHIANQVESAQASR